MTNVLTRSLLSCSILITVSSCHLIETTAPQRVELRPSADYYAGYSHTLSSGGDVLEWLAAINSDCSDSVDATISAGTFALPFAPPDAAPGYGNLVIQHTCGTASPSRSVHIHGAGPSQTILVQLNTTWAGYASPLDGFLVKDNNVY
ncbi:MAG: hypothetical protein ABI328_02140, partial [Gemmatimonadaceae bacterium]